MLVAQSFAALNLRDVARHEIGHFLALPHSKNAGNAMFPFFNPANETKGDLKGERSSCVPTECGHKLQSSAQPV